MEVSNGRLHEKVAIVTGASGGIGRAIAIAMAAQGTKLVVCADSTADISSMDEGKPTHEEICSRFGSEAAIFLRCDVRRGEGRHESSAAVQHVVQETVNLTGRLDIFVNTVSILVDKPLHELDDESWNEAMSVNATGTFHGIKYAVRQFLAQELDEHDQRGCVINVSSIGSRHGLLGCSAYCASQAAITGLTRAAAVDYGGRGIRVNAICPGYIQVSMIEQCLSVPEYVQRWTAGTPAGRLGRPSDCVGAAIWLACGAESAFVNGSSIFVDGGFHVF